MEPVEAGHVHLIIGDTRRRVIHVLQPYHQGRHPKIYPQPKHLSYYCYSRFSGRVPLVLRDEDAWPIFAYRSENTLCWQDRHLANGFYPRSRCSVFANTIKAIFVIELATNKDLVRAGKSAGENMFSLSVGSELNDQASCTTGCIHGGACYQEDRYLKRLCLSGS